MFTRLNLKTLPETSPDTWRRGGTLPAGGARRHPSGAGFGFKSHTACNPVLGVGIVVLTSYLGRDSDRFSVVESDSGLAMEFWGGWTYSFDHGPEGPPPGPNRPAWDRHPGTYEILLVDKVLQVVEIKKEHGYLVFDDARLIEITPPWPAGAVTTRAETAGTAILTQDQNHPGHIPGGAS